MQHPLSLHMKRIPASLCCHFGFYARKMWKVRQHVPPPVVRLRLVILCSARRTPRAPSKHQHRPLLMQLARALTPPLLLPIVYQRHGKPEGQRHRTKIDQPNVAHACKGITSALGLFECGVPCCVDNRLLKLTGSVLLKVTVYRACTCTFATYAEAPRSPTRISILAFYSCHVANAGLQAILQTWPHGTHARSKCQLQSIPPRHIKKVTATLQRRASVLIAPAIAGAFSCC